MNTAERCIAAYAEAKHLKLAAKIVGIPWQTVYWHLRKQGVPVTGDRSRYGSESDRLGAHGERLFMKLVPQAVDHNLEMFQPKVDFTVGDVTVDVKTASLRGGRWSFSVKKQKLYCDFFVMFALSSDKEHVASLMIPTEVLSHHQTISLSNNRRGKWWDFHITNPEIQAFFEEVVA